ncbi:MAG: 2-polyprenyl-6-methoxyphenol hydroxylase-like oxidoreductase, partial [Chloroflexota bacterium]|nr:2-polyprenyl-6-methoxyphenol hydroxylase-like oxidoreductase [Chloroflexota bacterium]
CRRFPPRVPLLSCSRELLEWRLRQRVAALPNVRIQDGSEVLGPLPGRHGSVAGVRWRARGRGEPRQEAALHAEFVVDASGRTSRAPSWLADLGHPPPPETIVDAFLGYASRVYSRPPGCRADWQGVYLQAKPPAHPRAGVLLPIEGDRWLVGLVGAGRDYPPTDEAGFLAFARSLRSPVLYEAIKDAEPRSPIFGHRQTSNRRRHFERLAHWPAGFVVVGDAVCAFNPVYAQGITVAALAALALDEALRGQQRQGRELADSALRVQHAVAHSADLAWLMATGEDLRYPTTEGPRSGFLARLMQRYADGVIRAAMENEAANTAFLDVMHMRASPATLFRPRVVTAVLRMTGRRATAGTYPNALLDRAS